MFFFVNSPQNTVKKDDIFRKCVDKALLFCDLLEFEYEIMAKLFFKKFNHKLKYIYSLIQQPVGN